MPNNNNIILPRLYDLTMRLATHRYAVWWLGLVSFFESIVFPIPTDAILIPMTLTKRQHAWHYALVSTITSTAGGVVGYMIGWYLFDIVGKPIIELYGLTEQYSKLEQNYIVYGFWFTILAGITPFPYKLITITNGAMGFNLMTFIISSIIGRGIRFYGICALIYWLGPSIHRYIVKYKSLVWLIIVLAAVFIIIKYMF